MEAGRIQPAGRSLPTPGLEADALKQDWPVDSTVQLEDMSFDPDDRMYACDCRCGGGFSISEQEVEETQQEDGKEGTRRSVLVCCDTCSLSVCVTWTSTWKARDCGGS